MTPNDIFLDIGFQMHVREWGAFSLDSGKTPFILVHGLASNAQTWDGVGRALAGAGHPTIAIDQRGHGMSDKPPVEAGYDFETVTHDLKMLIDAMGWDRPIMAGQSWGGNVMLSFGARYPGVASGLVFVDGGFFDLQMRFPEWERARELMAPPNLLGIPRERMKSRMKAMHPDWSDEGLEGQLANFELLADGTIRPRLSRDRHMTILHALWKQRPPKLYPQLQERVLVCVAGADAQKNMKGEMVSAAAEGIERVTVELFDDSPHDIHVAQPEKLANLMLSWLNEGAE